MILIIDNYDSFTYNLYQYVGELYEDIRVVRNDQIKVDDVKNMNLEGIILSPGPGIPENAGICIELIKKLGMSVPILGICLGHQAIGATYGGNIMRAKNIRHGKTSIIKTSGDGVFKNIEKEMKVMRYHSLIVDEHTLPSELIITARSLDDDVIMGLKHKNYKVYGVQFHPESIFTDHGKEIIKNFVEGICNVARCHQENRQ